ncbi:hypothetical protein KL921_001338 [Ogataea angusta]|nr:hypothetical protein KL921_001338 [Ogataea angusta]KAG7830140.1 hypothetical protein KL920_001778 [Ogataea angusta]
MQVPAVIPSYGIHPWYSHLFSFVPVNTEEEKRKHYHEILNPLPTEELLTNLPMPIYLGDHIRTIERYLEAGGTIGEIGLDKVFRVPNSGFMGPLEGSGLSSCRVSMDHQVSIFETFLRMAQAKNKPVSIHCVGCHGKLFDSVQKIVKSPGLVTLHSYSGSYDQFKLWMKQYPDIRLSVSKVLNLDRYKDTLQMISIAKNDI